MKLMFRIICFGLAAVCLTSPLVAQQADEAGDFGSSTNTGSALIGIFYDLKQSQKRQPVNADYMRSIAEFIDGGWDENLLSRFFRVTKPLYASDVFIPDISAGDAPKAYHVDDIVRPRHWIVVYKGQVSPPEDGTYRFVAYADDVIAVGVNGKTNVVAYWAGWHGYTKWRESEPGPGGLLKNGDWFECRKDQIIDLDILIGEYPGSRFGAWLFIEKKGASYSWGDSQKAGKVPMLPVFQVAPRAISSSEGRYPFPFTTDSAPWKCYQ